MAATVIIAGAGIGGLAAAQALAIAGHFHVAVFEEAPQLVDIGAGLQLSPNASRILLSLGLGERLAPHVVAPEELLIRTGTGEPLARMPLGKFAEERYGAPYWVIHRADLQMALLDAVRANPDITLTLDSEVDSFTASAEGVLTHVVTGRSSIESDDGTRRDVQGVALIGADGLSSMVRYWLAPKSCWRTPFADQPRYSGRTAWRATVPFTAVAEEFRGPAVNLWLGRNAHLVHYPVKGGTAINIVAIARDDRSRPNWSADHSEPQEVLAHYANWCDRARAVLGAPDLWLRWPLFDRPPAAHWGRGPVTLLGDAAHPMLPFLAQGAAMAIEDAAVLADCLHLTPDAPEKALRLYEGLRQPRTARVQRAARRNGRIYHLGWPASLARDHVLRRSDGESLLARFDWLYDWRPNLAQD